MKTLVIRTPEVVLNPEDFKRMGHSNIGYTADLGAINPSQPALFGFNMDTPESPITVTIEGATIYRVSGGVIDFANPADGVMAWNKDQTGAFVGIAFVPTKQKGYIRISSKGGAIYSFLGAYTASDAIQFRVEPSEFKNMRNFIWDFSVPAGYSQKITLVGDINGFSNSDKLLIFGASVTNQMPSDFSYDYWDKPLPATLTNFSVNNTLIKADIDLSIFKNTDLAELRVYSNLGFSFFGDISHLLATASQLILRDNFSQEGITGSINSIATNFEQILLNAPNLSGGYTTRNYPLTYVNLKINAPKVPASDWDLLLSDLANKAPNLTSGVVQVDKRTAASDASVATLTTKGVSVIVGF